MTNTTLVVMAAGLGSRFGGVKQLAPVGPDGEVILDYTIRDAVGAGVSEVVLIVRRDILADTREHVQAIHGDDVAVRYVCQDELGPPRDKPWGTVHAVLSAADSISTPFVLANADDYYGPSSFALATGGAQSLDESHGLLVAFEVGKTLPASGAVTRGVCEVTDGRLTGIDETSGLARDANGVIGIEGTDRSLDPSTPVSMNLWAFHPSILGKLQGRWDAFFAAHGSEEKAECLLPTEIGVLMEEDGFVVDVIGSAETWTGLTNPDDLETVRAMIAASRV